MKKLKLFVAILSITFISIGCNVEDDELKIDKERKGYIAVDEQIINSKIKVDNQDFNATQNENYEKKVNDTVSNNENKEFTKYIDEILHFSPEIFKDIDISPEGLEKWNEYEELLDKYSSDSGHKYIDEEAFEQLKEEEKSLYYQFSDLSSPWDVSPRCGWYCGGSVDKIYATSNLKEEGKINYIVDNVHDFSTSTVWSEGVDGYGIGEKIDYHISDYHLPRAIDIYNGYAKTEECYYENSRVKELAIYINNVLYCILDLKDTWELQRFTIGNSGLPIDDTNNKLSFEIVSVYEGENYEDTCIADIIMSGGH